jgi:von Willebrand factor type A domain
MKRVLGIVCLLVCASAVWADEAFLLNVPLRFMASQETGEVRITLTLSAVPAGSQLIVNNATTVNLGTTAMASGDSVSLQAGVGNSVKITYQPLTNFSGGNFCQGAGAMEKNIPMRFVGPNVTKYNITSYVVASPTVDCTKPSKRTSDMPANLVPNDDGVAPALDAEYGGRHPLDVAIVLDRSGSMTEFPPDSSVAPTKAEILKSAMKTFVATWSEMDVPYSDDRMGIVFFSSTAAAQSFPGGDPPSNFFVKRGTDGPGINHDWWPLGTNIDTLSPGGATSIGAGINTAMQQWTADPKNDLAVVVVTDGKQNTAPLVQPAGSGFLALPPVGGLPDELRKRFIPIQTIGFNTPGMVDGQLLTNIAFETSGVSYIGINAQTMFDLLSWTLISLLKGNTAAMALRRNDTIVGTTPGPLVPVLVDRSAERVVFSVQWAPPRVNALDFDVYRPDGTPATPDSASSTPQSRLKSFNMDPSEIGTWSVRVKRSPNYPNPPTDSVPYTLHIYFMERHLDFRITLDPLKPSTGAPVNFKARVSWDGKMLDNLPAGAIKIRVQRPNEGLGTILHDTSVQVGTGITTTPSGDTQTPYDRKVARLSGASLVARVMPQDVETITLVHEGNGVYGGSFTGTTVPGQYGFEAVLDWSDRRTGRLRREERLEASVKVKPDPAMTTRTMSSNVGGTVTITVTPRDRYGNYLGPGYGSLVKTTLRSPGRLQPTVDPDQLGVYVITVTEVPAGTLPDVEIIVDGIRI